MSATAPAARASAVKTSADSAIDAAILGTVAMDSSETANERACAGEVRRNIGTSAARPKEPGGLLSYR
jgi:hypothetical protein